VFEGRFYLTKKILIHQARKWYYQTRDYQTIGVYMKIDRLEAHDRLLHFKQDQEANIMEGFLDCLKKNPLSLALQAKSPYIYIFAHPRTCEDGVTKKMLWQPRLGKPEPQTNSYLFRVESNTENVEICWMIPPREMWPQYKKGNVTEHQIVNWSIDQFTNHRNHLAHPYNDDFSEGRIRSILERIAIEMDQEKQNKKYLKV